MRNLYRLTIQLGLLCLLTLLPGACSKSGNQEKPPAKPDTPAAGAGVHHTFRIPVETLGERHPDLSRGDAVWALLPYPGEPQKYRLAHGELLDWNDQGAIVENSGTRTGSIPWTLVHPMKPVDTKPGAPVLVAGSAGVYMARVVEVSPTDVKIRRIWRDSTRTETVSSRDLIVQTPARGFGQVVFYNYRNRWNQGLMLLEENRHIWVTESLGGIVIQVGAVNTVSWNPDFVPQLEQDVEACRSGSSNLNRATIQQVHEDGLFYSVRLSNLSIRQHVPFWEILPAGLVL